MITTWDDYRDLRTVARKAKIVQAYLHGNTKLRTNLMKCKMLETGVPIERMKEFLVANPNISVEYANYDTETTRHWLELDTPSIQPIYLRWKRSENE